ncbi:unnamed protein product [Echinostoma caproni]|uniref:Ovule protein n=1 Tax=Echinostoma caproni TaxID=27848 RepID=A0A183A7T6_9TREM|nr:unnamed protein product [Echinostoma caproni]
MSTKQGRGVVVKNKLRILKRNYTMHIDYIPPKSQDGPQVSTSYCSSLKTHQKFDSKLLNLFQSYTCCDFECTDCTRFCDFYRTVIRVIKSNPV